MPQEIEGPWQIPANGTKDVLLAEGVVHLATTSTLGSAAAAGPLVLGEGAVSLAPTSILGGSTSARASAFQQPSSATGTAASAAMQQRPKHIVVEGVSVKG